MTLGRWLRPQSSTVTISKVRTITTTISMVVIQLSQVHGAIFQWKSAVNEHLGQSGKTPQDINIYVIVYVIIHWSDPACPQLRKTKSRYRSDRIYQEPQFQVCFWPLRSLSFRTWALCSHLDPVYPPAEEDSVQGRAQESSSASWLQTSFMTLGQPLKFCTYVSSLEKQR